MKLKQTKITFHLRTIQFDSIYFSTFGANFDILYFLLYNTIMVRKLIFNLFGTNKTKLYSTRTTNKLRWF